MTGFVQAAEVDNGLTKQRIDTHRFVQCAAEQARVGQNVNQRSAAAVVEPDGWAEAKPLSLVWLSVGMLESWLYAETLFQPLESMPALPWTFEPPYEPALES